MRANHAKRRLAAGEPSIGTWLSLPSPEAAEYIAEIGFDWLTVDAEHNGIDVTTMSRMFGAIAGNGTAPLVRIPWNSGENIKRALDAGAWGIVVPMVNSRAEAEAAVEAALFPPKGNRSIGGNMRTVRWKGTGAEYHAHADEEILIVLQIEHIKGVEAADEILSVPGVDACFIGPNDLAASMGVGIGVPLEFDHPDMIVAINEIREACVRNGVAPGIHTSGAAGLKQRIAEGFRFLAMASELKYMLGGLQSDLQASGWQSSPHRNIGDDEATIPTRTDSVRY
ncbi:MAG TPA: aldolase/citrate lyase family protein [Thermomicrobiales bacterium]|nr:aldolase/citrate lyase family protein [Thermomicrobiales bacterium]HRA47808.1 aldolase/citrate lyase family protein [Thermomicrobiales bacterium]